MPVRKATLCPNRRIDGRSRHLPSPGLLALVKGSDVAFGYTGRRPVLHHRPAGQARPGWAGPSAISPDPTSNTRPPRRCVEYREAWQAVRGSGPTMRLVIASSAVFACLVLGAMAVFQALLALGAPLGRFAWGGQHRILPGSLRAGSTFAIVIYGLLAAVVLVRAGVIESGVVPPGVVHTAAWVVVAYFLLGVALNLASQSKPERAVMAPVSAVLCASCVVVALG